MFSSDVDYNTIGIEHRKNENNFNSIDGQYRSPFLPVVICLGNIVTRCFEKLTSRSVDSLINLSI